MTETVVVIDADRPVSEASDCFAHYGIHHLPVLSEGRLAGMLSSADLAKLEFAVPAGTPDETAYLDERYTIRDVMRAPAMSLAPHDSVGAAGERMIGDGVHAAPVVDGGEHVVGIVTSSDIIRALLHGPPRRGALPMGRSMPSGGDPEQEALHFHARPSAEELAMAMSTAELLHVENRDLRFLGKTLLYLEQRRRKLEKVFELADRFLLSGQDEQVHALLLKAIHAAKRAEEHAAGKAGTPFPLE
jgi:acetoin utilization protein AcuB